MKDIRKKRILYVILTVVTMILGLMTRKFDYIFPNLISSYGGDILWATMVYFGFRIIFASSKNIKSLILAIIFSYSIEISQLYHREWIDNIRKTTLGGLILGYGFLYSDLVCYLVGILIGFFIDKFILKLYYYEK